MPALADLASFRLVRALRAGQPGAFPSLWNAQAGSVWSVVRAMVATDAVALGWMTSFRVELGELVVGFDPEIPLAEQVGLALHAHLAPAFRRDAPLPEGPLAPDDAGLRALPERARLLYLLALYFDLADDDLARRAGGDAPALVRAVAHRLEPAEDTDAHQVAHAALLRNPPATALILPPGADTPPPRRPWGWWIAGALLVAAIAGGFAARAMLTRTSWSELTALHVSTLAGPNLMLQGDPGRLSAQLSAAGLPSDLLSVPELTSAGLTLLGGRALPGAVPGVVLVYSAGTELWTLQHHERPRPEGGDVVASAGEGAAELDAVSAGGVVVVAWTEGDTLWLLGSGATPAEILQKAEDIRAHRAAQDIVPFLGNP